MDVTEKEDERLEETLKDVKRKWPYYSAFCLQYTPRDCHHEEKIVLRKILWTLANEVVQGCILLRSSEGVKATSWEVASNADTSLRDSLRSSQDRRRHHS